VNLGCKTQKEGGYDNIKMDVKETQREDEDWTEQAQERVQWQAFVKIIINVWVP
jgi:hypothetical protein